MELNVCADRNLVEIWLTQAEKQDQQLHERLKPIYAACKQHHYLAVVFQSGDQSLYENTLELLRYNRQRSAELEVQAAKVPRPSACTAIGSG